MVKATCIRSDKQKIKDIVSKLFSVNWSPHFVKSSILIYILHVSLVNFSRDTEFTSVTKNGTCLSNQPKW